MGTGAAISTGIGFFGPNAVVALLAGTALLAAVIFAIGKRSIGEPITVSEAGVISIVH